MFLDPDFGTQIMKVADRSQVNKGRSMRQDYSKVNPFNANSTLAVLRLIGDGSWWLYDVATWKPLHELSIAQGEPEIRWSPTDPDTFYYVEKNTLFAYHPSTNTYTIVHQFIQCKNSYYSITDKNEGNLSLDGNRIAFYCAKSSKAASTIIVYDIPTNTIIYEGISPQSFGNMDWVSISPSGKYFVIMIDRPVNTLVYDATTGVLVQSIQNIGHADMGYDGSGAEVIVIDGADDPNPQHCEGHTGGCRWIIKYDLVTGVRTNILPMEWDQ